MTDQDPIVERTIIDRPVVVRRELIRTGGTAGWWVAALVALVAIASLVFLYDQPPSGAQLQAAQDQGRAQAAVDDASVQAQTAAQSAQISASAASANAADSQSQASRAAAENAGARAARAAQDAAANASDTAPDQTPR